MRFYLHHLLLAAVAAQLPLASAQDAQGDHHQALHVARSEALVRARDAIAEAKVYNDQILARDTDDALLLVARGSKPSKPSPPAPGPAKPANPPPKIPKLRKCVQCGQMCPLGEQFHAHGKVLRFMCEDLPGQQTK
ncbi:hypothetical protein RB595_008823 [Gaeumannomyces hyphopodioides]